MGRYAWFALRFKILQRDNFTCRYCGQFAPNVTLEVDHVIPYVEGGTDEDDNLVTSCRACNRGKEALRSIRPHPKTPGRKPKTFNTPSGMVEGGMRQAILSVMRSTDKPLRPAEIATLLGTKPTIVRARMYEMRKRGEL